jgi:hypothetical protein
MLMATNEAKGCPFALGLGDAKLQEVNNLPTFE